MSGDLRGRAGIVTGAASGIGAATARRLAEAGARLVLGDVAEAELRKVADDVERLGGLAETAVVDVRRWDDVAAMERTCRKAFRAVDFAVASAGIAEGSSLAEGDPELWRAVLDTNVLGVAHTIRAVLPGMRANGRGHIVLVASISGRIAYVGEPIYLASKWAVVGLGHAARKEALGYGVRVTLIEPGLVDTPLSRGTPLGREELTTVEPLAPDDVAEAIAYALEQPAHVVVNELSIQPLQEL